MVNPAEVGNDHWDRQSNDQHTTQRTNRAKYLASNCLGHHVAITGGKKRQHQMANYLNHAHAAGKKLKSEVSDVCAAGEVILKVSLDVLDKPTGCCKGCFQKREAEMASEYTPSISQVALDHG